MTRRRACAAALLIGLAVFSGAVPRTIASAPARPVRLVLVTHEWGDDESTLIEDAVNGLHDFQAATGRRGAAQDWIAVKRTGTTDLERGQVYDDALALLRAAARSNDCVIAWGNLLTGPVLAVAREFPHVRFGLVSSVYVDRIPANVVEASFRVEEEAFLAGAAAAMASHTGIVGYVGAVESFPRRIGFGAGVYYANPNVRALYDNVGFSTTQGAAGPTIASWIEHGSFEPAGHDRGKAQEVALSQFDRGADVIYAAAGGSNAGVYEAAAVRGRWIIGSGGERMEPALPVRWQRQMFTVIGERADLATRLLATQLTAGPIRVHHVFWGLTYPGPPVPMIGFQAHKQQFERIRPYLKATILEIGLHRVKVPFNNPQLGDFLKEFQR